MSGFIDPLSRENQVKHLLQRIWREEEGVLTFEWILLTTVLVIGIVGGVAAVRDALIDELGDVAQAMMALNQSYCIQAPLWISVVHEQSDSSASQSAFVDFFQFQDCSRYCTPKGGTFSLDSGTPVTGS